MLIIILALALSVSAFGAEEKAEAKQPAPVADKDRAAYAAAVARVAIAQAQAAELRAKFLEVQAQHDGLAKALRTEIERLRKASSAGENCELDLEGKWVCTDTPAPASR